MFRRFITVGKKQLEKISTRTSLAISFLAIVFLLGWGAGSAHATPSTIYWTPSVMDIQPFGVWHLGIDNYFPLNGPVPGKNFGFATDVGLTVGVLPFSKINMEVGVDLLEPIDSGICAGALKMGPPLRPATHWVMLFSLTPKSAFRKGPSVVGHQASLWGFSMSVLKPKLPTWILAT